MLGDNKNRQPRMKMGSNIGSGTDKVPTLAAAAKPAKGANVMSALDDLEGL